MNFETVNQSLDNASLPQIVIDFCTKDEYSKDVVYYERVEHGIVARVFHKYYRGQTEEKQRNFFMPQDIARFRFYTKYMYDAKTRAYLSCEQQWCRTKTFGRIADYPSIIQKPDELRKVFKDTFIAKSPWLDYGEQSIYALYKFIKWPALEYLVKMGYDTLVREIINGRNIGDNSVNLYKRKANEVLGVPHSILQNYNPKTLRECDIKAIKQLIGFGRLGQLTPERFEVVKGFLSRMSLDPLEIFRTFGIEKVLNYLSRQAEQCGQPFSVVQIDFIDYREQCHRLGRDITDEGVMFPRDLLVAHHGATEIMRRQREQERRQQRVLDLEQKLKPYVAAVKGFLDKEFANENYIIRVAKTPREIDDEGKALKHCVGSYVDRVINKYCMIFFVRLREAPNKPLYTLEVSYKEKSIIQCRGFANKQAPTEILGFVKQFFQEVA